MVFVVKCCRTEVDETNFAVKKYTSLASIPRVRVGGRGDGTVVGEGLVCAADKEDVFGFEIGVNEVEVMEDLVILATKKRIRASRKTRYLQATLVKSCLAKFCI